MAPPLISNVRLMKEDHLVAAVQFAELAREFSNWVEQTMLAEEHEVSVARWLARLHAAALALPEVDSGYCDGLPEIQDAHFQAARANVAWFSGMYYRECFDPDPLLADEPVLGDVGDDLLDTYQDIKRGLLHFDRSEPIEALWFWSFNHQIHWGRHAVGAMYALQCLTRRDHE